MNDGDLPFLHSGGRQIFLLRVFDGRESKWSGRVRTELPRSKRTEGSSDHVFWIIPHAVGGPNQDSDIEFTEDGGAPVGTSTEPGTGRAAWGYTHPSIHPSIRS